MIVTTKTTTNVVVGKIGVVYKVQKKGPKEEWRPFRSHLGT